MVRRVELAGESTAYSLVGRLLFFFHLLAPNFTTQMLECYS